MSDKPEAKPEAGPESKPVACIACGRVPAEYFVFVTDTTIAGPYCGECSRKSRP